MCAFFTYLKIPTQQNNECNIDQMEISDVCVPSCVSENHPDFIFFHFMSKIGMMIKVCFHTNFFATKAIGRKNVVYHILLVMMANFHPKMLKIKTMIIFVFSENDYYRTILFATLKLNFIFLANDAKYLPQAQRFMIFLVFFCAFNGFDN